LFEAVIILQTSLPVSQSVCVRKKSDMLLIKNLRKLLG